MKNRILLILTILLMIGLSGCSDKDTTHPTFMNNPGDLTYELGEVIDVFDLGLTASDDIDGDITNKITVNTDDHIYEPGAHEVIYTVYDHAGNVTTLTITITFVDTIAPVIVMNPENKQTTFDVGSEVPDWTNYISLEDELYIPNRTVLNVDEQNVDMDTVGSFTVSITLDDYYGNESLESLITITIVPQWTDDEYFNYTLINNDTEVKILNYLGTGPKDVVIPLYLGGLPVTEIEHHAFKLMNIFTVVIPEGVTTIGDYAFNDNNLEEVILPSTLVTLGFGAFLFNHISEVTIPESLESFIPGTFYDNDVENYYVDENNPYFESIEGVLFNEDFTLLVAYPTGNIRTSYIIPEGIISIEDWAFEKHYLDTVILPSTLLHIGEGSFSDGTLTEIVLHEGLLTIGSIAFEDNLLPSVDIPSTVTFIGNKAFAINQIVSFSVSLDNQDYQDIDGVLFTKDGELLINYPEMSTNTDYVIPSGVTDISALAFYQSQLTSITIPVSVQTIGYDAFLLSDITSITIEGDQTRFNDIWDIIGLPSDLMPTE